MFGKASLGFLVCAFCIKFARSIELNLPLSEDDAQNFKITKLSCLDPVEGYDPILTCTRYEALENDLIRRVVFFNFELINDTEERDPNFRRVVDYGVSKHYNVISILKKEGAVDREEGVYIFNAEELTIMSSFSGFFENAMLNVKSQLGKTLSSIFVKDKKIKKNNYDDLDTVDDEPYLLRGRVDISSEEIEKQVQEIIKEYSKPIDKDVAGPSGLSRNLKRKIQEDSDTDSDSD